MNIKSVIAIALASGVVVGLGFGLVGKQTEEPAVSTAQPQVVDANDPNRVAEGAPIAVMQTKPAEKPTEAPNFDTRKVQVAEKKPESLMSSEQSSKVIAEKQAEMENLIELYNQSLSDPKAKADLERKFKLHSEEYKKAILAKVKQGEL